MENNLNHIFELQYAMDTFYFLVCGALVMWMAAGFSMLEAGLVRSKNTTEILTKNVALFAIACTMYLICGYQIMYGGGYFLSGITTVGGMDDAALRLFWKPLEKPDSATWVNTQALLTSSSRWYS